MKRFKSLIVAMFCVVAVLLTGQALAEWVQVATLTPSDGVMGDRFGYGAVYDGTRALIAAQYHSVGGVATGAAYLYEPDGEGGYDEYKLVPSDAGDGDQVGGALFLSGDYAYVGTGKHDPTIGGTTYTDAGAVWVFQRQIVGSEVQWNQVAKIVAPTPANSVKFGASVTVDGGNMCIGSTGTKNADFYQGSGSSWSWLQTVTSSAGSFGVACDIDGDTAIVVGHTGGTVAVYDYDDVAEDWGSTTTVSGSGSARFGINATLDGDNLVAGADRTTVSGLSRAGAAYIHGRDQDGEDAWGQVAMLTSDDPQANGYFGYANSIDGNRLVISAYCEDHGTDADTGAVYVYEYGSSWTQVDKFFGPVAGEQFGVGVSLVGDNVLIGDYSATAGNKAYIYHYVPEPGMMALLIGLAWGGVLLRGHRR